jgi:hypothetical protein
MNNFVALDNEEIVIYNEIQSKVFKYFINHHKNYDFKFDDQVYQSSIKYCKNFKYDVCLCYREKTNINDDYLNIYHCPNNKRIFYNTYDFNFIKPVIITADNNKTYPVDVFNFYRQEYLPFIIHETFMKYKEYENKIKIIRKNKLLFYFNHFKLLKYNKILIEYVFIQFKKIIKTIKQQNIDFINKKILLCYFNHFKLLKSYKINKIKIHNHYNTNSYYNDLIGVFDNDNDNDNVNDNINDIKPLIEIQTNNNNYYAIAVILNDYKKLMGDYNDLIISIICNK